MIMQYLCSILKRKKTREMNIDQNRFERKEAWRVGLVFMPVIAFFNILVIGRYAPVLTPMVENYHQLMLDEFHISGFDAWTYSVISDWNGWEINVYRHPLYAIFLYVPYLVNRLLMGLTGMNCALHIMAVINTAVGTASLVVLYLMMREVVGLGRRHAGLLVGFFYSFAYVMLTMMVPDHFNPSLLLLLSCLYVAGRCMVRRKPMSIAQTVMWFVLTAGVSLNNGVKVFLASLFVNGRKYFRPKYLLLSTLVPAALLWGFTLFEYRLWTAPLQAAFEQKQKAREKAYKDSIRTAFVAEHPEADSAEVAHGVKSIMKQKAWERYKKNHENPKIGDPISKEGFMAWTDKTTSRWNSGVENLFGESFQLHRPYLLKDLMTQNRPMIVQYENDWHYVAELLLVLFFVAGIIYSCRQRFFWMVASWFALDMLVFFVLGFAINEIYIMTAGWAFIIPIALAYMLKNSRGWLHRVLTAGIAALTVYLLVYNGSLIVHFLTA